MSKPTWEQYFLNIAREVSTRATCDRLHVGCVVVRDKQILATGYNGSAIGAPHCDDEGHQMVDGHCVRTVHAEANAIAQAARTGVKLEGSTIYVTHKPCYGCHKLIQNAGISFVIFDTDYGSEYPELVELQATALDVKPVDYSTQEVPDWAKDETGSSSLTRTTAKSTLSDD